MSRCRSLCLALAVSAAAGRADELSPRVDAVFAAYDKTASPGCALGVFRDGALVYGRGYGMANLEHGIALSTRSVFDIGSTSKQFTAMSVALLAERGRLSLDDEVRRHVPELPAYGRPVTIRQLLHHTSGLRDYLTLMSLAGVRFDDWTTDQDALELIVRQRETNFPPGSEYLYSNSGYFLLSVIVKRASGRSLREFARENLFGPLGMRDTHFHDDHGEWVPRRATAYAPREGGGFRIEMSNFEQTGDGAVYTTVEDLLLWDRNFYDGKLGGAELLRRLQAPGRLEDGQPLNYAQGLIVRPHRGLQSVRHGGSWAGYRAELLRFPERRLSVACLCNVASADPGSLAERVAEIYLGDALEPAPAGPAAAPELPAGGAVPPSETELGELAGLYRDPSTGSFLRLAVEAGRLVHKGLGAALAPLSPARFRAVDPALEIAFEPGPPRRARVRSGGREQLYEAVAPPPLAAATLAGYAGDYWSDELQAGYTLRVEGGALLLRRRNNPERRLTPYAPDAFTDDRLTLAFARSGSRVTGFALGAGRVRNLRFVKRG